MDTSPKFIIVIGGNGCTAQVVVDELLQTVVHSIKVR